MTPPLDSGQSARCGRSSMFLEQGTGPTLPCRLAGRHALVRGPCMCICVCGGAGAAMPVLWAQ